jgi:hypothetical protein
MNRASIALALSMMASCSFAFVQPAHHDRPGGVAGCTSEPTAPVVDTLLALANLGSAIYVASQSNVANRGAAVGLGLGFAGVFVASAIYGYVTTSTCAELLLDDPDRNFLPPAYPGGPAWRPPVPPLPPN